MFGLPYLAIGAAIACAVAFGAGWHYGGKVVRADWAGERIAAAVAKADADERIYGADRKADALAAELRRVRAQKQRVIVQEVVVDAALPDPVECHLDARRVSTINRAVRATATDSGGQAAAVPAAGRAGGREPQPDRAVGGADGVRLPGVR